MNLIHTIRAFLGLVPTTEKAIAGITKAIDNLNAVVQIENDAIDALDARISKAAAARLDAFTRRDRAAKIAGRIDALIA
ncbi:MAG: hypothetical protein E5X41_15025 [Mesorhizobium sp.]|nr:MAG: hypothetical protein E5X41_15025 [Mesorhizobium sp.]